MNLNLSIDPAFLSIWNYQTLPGNLLESVCLHLVPHEKCGSSGAYRECTRPEIFLPCMAWLSRGTVEEQKLCPGIRSRVLERIVKNFKNHKQVFERALIKFNRRRCFSSLVKTFDYSAMGSTSAVVAIIIVMFFHPPWSIGQPSDFVQIRTDSFGKQTVRDVRARRTRASSCTVIVGACFTTTKLWSRMRPGLLGTDQNGTDRQIDSCSGRNDWGVVGVYMEQHLHP